jgi:hypothetical protein
MSEPKQPQLCDTCLQNVSTVAAATPTGSWAGLYCPHNLTLSLFLVERGTPSRMQLNAPFSEDEAKEHVERVIYQGAPK